MHHSFYLDHLNQRYVDDDYPAFISVYFYFQLRIHLIKFGYKNNV